MLAHSYAVLRIFFDSVGPVFYATSRQKKDPTGFPPSGLFLFVVMRIRRPGL